MMIVYLIGALVLAGLFAAFLSRDWDFSARFRMNNGLAFVLILLLGLVAMAGGLSMLAGSVLAVLKLLILFEVVEVSLAIGWLGIAGFLVGGFFAALGAQVGVELLR